MCQRNQFCFWLKVICSVLILTACTAKESEDQIEKEDIDRPKLSESDDWNAPGLVDPSGNPIEVPKPNPTTGKTLNILDFGANPEPNSQDDAEAIRKAIEAAEPGDEVFLPAGTYDLLSTDPADNTANIVLRSEVNIRGEGQDRTVLLTYFDGEDDSKVILGSGVEDIIVSDLTITSTYDGPLGDDTDDRNSDGGPKYGIYIGTDKGKPSSSVLVENVGIRKFESHGISVKASREVILSRNYISEATSVGPGGKGYGIAIEGLRNQNDPNTDNDSRHNVVIGNTFDGKHLRHAILLQFPTHNNLVAENIIVGSHLDAIDLHGEGEYLNEIRDNTIINGQRAGIALGNSGGSKDQHDASGQGNWIHSNILIGNSQGILVILGTPNTFIENNRIIAGEGSKAGIEVRNAPGTELRGNFISGGTDEFWAIKLNEDRGSNERGKGIPSDVQIECNVIRQAANGIKIDAGRDLTLGENVINDIEGTELMVADDIEVSHSIQRLHIKTQQCEG